jgi:hypothetical protein
MPHSQQRNERRPGAFTHASGGPDPPISGRVHRRTLPMYYLVKGLKSVGPFTLRELKDMLDRNEISDCSLVHEKDTPQTWAPRRDLGTVLAERLAPTGGSRPETPLLTAQRTLLLRDSREHPAVANEPVVPAPALKKLEPNPALRLTLWIGLAVFSGPLLIFRLPLGLAILVGIGLHRCVAGSGVPITPVEMGRRWLAWLTLIVSITVLPKFFRNLDGDSFAQWLIGLFVFAPLAFGLGWVYGKYWAFKSESAAPDSCGPKSACDLEPVSMKVQAERLSTLKSLVEQGLITTTDYEAKKKEILRRL